MNARLRDLGVELEADPSRVVLRLFLPGEGLTPTRSRTADVERRISTLSPAELAEAAAELVRTFGERHDELPGQLERNAATVMATSGAGESRGSGSDLRVVLGAAFSAEHSVEGAAVCNPSAVRHPDQTGLEPGELRLAVAMRLIGEGHVSSIGFAVAIVGPAGWRFVPRGRPAVTASVREGEWSRARFRSALESDRRLNELSSAVVRHLPRVFRSGQIEAAIAGVSGDLARRHETHGDLDAIRTMAWSAYEAEFEAHTELSQRVLVPVTEGESNGIEDARFVSYTGDDGVTTYRATYTAYDGRSIAPRLLQSDDLRSFSMHRLLGTAAVNKGMALFPRPIDGTDWALTRTDGENLSIASSADGREWKQAGVLQRPRQLWETVQLGNCGSPIETERGWLVITHGVGPMRRYALGAILLDLDDPRKLIAHLSDPLLSPRGALQEGYVPNVVYSCGGIAHDGTLWLPYGVGDQRIRAASIRLDDVLDAMAPMAANPA